MIILGIDPGLDGALCRIGGNGEIYNMWDTPVLFASKRRTLDYHVLKTLLGEHRPHHAFIEQCWNRPGQGSTGKMVGIYMAELMCLTCFDIPWTAVSPQRWKKSLDVPAAKDGARARASQLLPNDAHWWPLKKHDGRAEAALIALYGLRGLGLIEPPQPRLLPLPQLRPLVP